MSLLHRLITRGNYSATIRDLLRAGMNPNTTDEMGKTPLHIAVCKNEDNIQESEASLQVVRELIYFGADVNRTDNIGNTPLHFAVCFRNYEMMEILLKCNAGIDIQDDLGNTAMHYAIDNCNLLQWTKSDYKCPGEGSHADLAAVKLLMNYFPDINLYNILSEIPLIWAVKEQNHQIVQILLKKGASYSLRDIHGNDALHYSLDQVEINEGIVTELLKYGSNHEYKNNRSETPVDVYLKRLHNASPTEQKKAEYLFKIFVFQKNYFKNTQCREIADISRKMKSLLRKFFWYCRFEIEKMKIDELVTDYTIFQLASRGFYYNTSEEKPQSFEIFDKTLEKLKRGDYTVYIDIIVSGICRDYMAIKTAETGYWLDRKGERVEFLNFDTRYRLCYYLTNFEMFNLMLAFSSRRWFLKTCRICNGLCTNV
ncbi:serine/threonine-protein phosphatase 6 regulatory ankyrin repeat subunit B-like [Argiope bruennichi]|uniref:serine/threonine-protein phosphatase 6 regulatory ankyrin repeat subunit B-like n=1 Tax=Argiope bruennichi TaxID=94029 RepID=UPI0024953F7C|nr:serine/threonine-protein phosphatase 6 regulatory ankyrin repeat subunit B-like [Argiope bruennichi]